jgi:hypothetical protein
MLRTEYEQYNKTYFEKCSIRNAENTTMRYQKERITLLYLPWFILQRGLRKYKTQV